MRYKSIIFGTVLYFTILCLDALPSYMIVNEDFSGAADPLIYFYQDPAVSQDSFAWSDSNNNIQGTARRGRERSTAEYNSGAAGTWERAYIKFSAAGYGDADQYLEYTEDFDFSFDINFSSFAPSANDEDVQFGLWMDPYSSDPLGGYPNAAMHFVMWPSYQKFIGVKITDDGSQVQFVMTYGNAAANASDDLTGASSLSTGVNYRIEGHYRWDGATYGQLFGKLTNLDTGTVIGNLTQEVITSDVDIYAVAFRNFAPPDEANKRFLLSNTLGFSNMTRGTTQLTGPQFTSDNWTLSVYDPIDITSINVNPSLNAVYLGHTAKLFCEGFDSAGTRYDVTDWVQWSSENTGIVSINQISRTATGVSLGTTNIKAIFGGLESNLVPFQVLSARTPNHTSFGLDTLLQWRELPRLKTGTEAGMASSYYRNFTFNTTTGDFNCYDSHPYRATGDVDPVTVRVLQGPGIITRTWMPWVPGPEFKMKFYFDGETTPRLDTTTLNWYDSGISGHGAIQEPFVGIGTGGAFCYTPLYFQNSLRIESNNRTGLNNFYQMCYLYLPQDTIVETYTGEQNYTWWADWNLAGEILYAQGENPGPAGSQIIQTSGTVNAGQSLILANITDATGIVNRLQIKLDNPTDAQLSGGILRVFYGKSDTPSMDISLADFFGAGQGRGLYNALALGTDHADGYYCYLPMPFHRGIKIEILNGSAETFNILQAEVEYDICEIDKSYGCLYAVHNQTTLAPAVEELIEVLNIPFGEGHYLGCLMTVTPASVEYGYLEGNEKITVDGGLKETIYGTGLEDTFNGGYYYTGLFSGPFSGLLKKQSGITSQYRHYIMDFVPFENSILVQHQGVDCWNKEYQRTYDTTAYWYQKAAPFLQINRISTDMYRLTWDYSGSFEIEYDDNIEFDSPGFIDVTGLTQYDYNSSAGFLFFRLKNK